MVVSGPMTWNVRTLVLFAEIPVFLESPPETIEEPMSRRRYRDRRMIRR